MVGQRLGHPSECCGTLSALGWSIVRPSKAPGDWDGARSATARRATRDMTRIHSHPRLGQVTCSHTLAALPALLS